MKRTLIATLAAAGAVFSAAYLTGADGTTAQQTGTTGTQTPTQQTTQAPMIETEECEGYILLMPCPVCHTCPVCQSNCGTAHALRCCLGNRKPAPVTNGMTSGGQAGTPAQQHIMTNKAEAVKHAAGHGTSAQQPQIVDGSLSIITVESD